MVVGGLGGASAKERERRSLGSLLGVLGQTLRVSGFGV